MTQIWSFTKRKVKEKFEKFESFAEQTWKRLWFPVFDDTFKVF